MAQETFSFRGTFLNMKKIGFNPLNDMCEKHDNSISANAKTIRCLIDAETNKYIPIDDANGMNSDGLTACGKVNNRTDATATSHGRFGAGGQIADINITDLGKVHYISKPVNDPCIYEMTLNYDIQKNEDYKLHPHEASRRTEETWNTYAIDSNGNGTVQLLQSTPAIIKTLIAGIVSDDIITSYRFELACVYNKQLREGLNMEYRIGEKSYNIAPIDRLKYNEIVPAHKQTVIIKVCQLSDLSYRFYYTEKGDSYYRDCTNSTKGKGVKETPSKNPHTHIGDIVLRSTYHKDWQQFLKPDLDKMGLVINCAQDKARAKLGGMIYERNGKQIAQFPSSKAGDSAGLIPYLQGSHHNIGFVASEPMDDLFGVLVNKSNLVETNISRELLSTIEHICDRFAKQIQKIQAKVPLNVPATENTVVPTLVNAPIIPAAEPAKVAPVKVTPAKKVAPATAVIATALPTKVLPVKTATATPIKPATPIIPVVTVCNHNVNFSKTDTNIIVSNNQAIIVSIPYAGQYNITEKYYNEILMKLGEKRFIEYITKCSEMGWFTHNAAYFT
jgi:hypothetical protein